MGAYVIVYIISVVVGELDGCITCCCDGLVRLLVDGNIDWSNILFSSFFYEYVSRIFCVPALFFPPLFSFQEVFLYGQIFVLSVSVLWFDRAGAGGVESIAGR